MGWSSNLGSFQHLSELKEEQLINNLDVYPNPSRDIFNVTFESEVKQNIELRVVNLLGEILFKENLEKFEGKYSTSFNLIEYSKGIYMFELDSKNGVINKKIVLQ